MTPYRYDRCRNGSGSLIYARERAPVKELKQYKTSADVECGVRVIEINLKKQKFLRSIVPQLNQNSTSSTKLAKSKLAKTPGV